MAVSADTPAETAALADTLDLPFRLVPDPDMQIIRAFELVDPMAGRYARPATLIVDRDGVLRAVWLPGNYRVRVPPADIERTLRGL